MEIIKDYARLSSAVASKFVAKNATLSRKKWCTSAIYSPHKRVRQVHETVKTPAKTIVNCAKLWR